MKAVDIQQAKRRLSSLIDAARAGEDVILARDGKPIARIVALRGNREPGALKGRIRFGRGWDRDLFRPVR